MDQSPFKKDYWHRNPQSSPLFNPPKNPQTKNPPVKPAAVAGKNEKSRLQQSATTLAKGVGLKIVGNNVAGLQPYLSQKIKLANAGRRFYDNYQATQQQGISSGEGALCSAVGAVTQVAVSSVGQTQVYTAAGTAFSAAGPLAAAAIIGAGTPLVGTLSEKAGQGAQALCHKAFELKRNAATPSPQPAFSPDAALPAFKPSLRKF
jgi:hypothetical protein